MRGPTQRGWLDTSANKQMAMFSSPKHESKKVKGDATARSYVSQLDGDEKRTLVYPPRTHIVNTNIAVIRPIRVLASLVDQLDPMHALA